MIINLSLAEGGNVDEQRALPSPFIVRRVLIVDDNEDVAGSLASYLDQVGHSAVTAGTGDAALQIATVFRPDVAILDIGLPDMNGAELASRLREQGGSTELLLIAVSGYGPEKLRSLNVDSIFKHIFTKPSDPKTIAECLQTSITAPN
jgi:DNA-binding response OmpR family regulator